MVRASVRVRVAFTAIAAIVGFVAPAALIGRVRPCAVRTVTPTNDVRAVPSANDGDPRVAAPVDPGGARDAFLASPIISRICHVVPRSSSHCSS
jgi:hypothetical protein